MIQFALVMAAATMTPMAIAALQDALVEELLGRITAKYKTENYAETGWQQRGALKQGGEISYRIKLKGGKEYTIAAACGTECGNLDAFLSDSNGKLVDSDQEEDDLPIVMTSVSGTYTVRLVMKTCTAATCSFGVRAYQQ